MIAIVLPITGTVDPGFLAGLHALSQGMTAAGAATEAAGTKAAAADGSWSQHIDTLRRGAQAFNETHQAITTIVGALEAAANEVTNLATEQAQLDATSRRLGLNFDDMATAAGRFTDETQAMALGTTLAAQGLHLTQQQGENLMTAIGAASPARRCSRPAGKRQVPSCTSRSSG